MLHSNAKFFGWPHILNIVCPQALILPIHGGKMHTYISQSWLQSPVRIQNIPNRQNRICVRTTHQV